MASDSVWLPGRIEVSSGGARNAEQFRKQESWPAAPPPSDSGDHPLSPTPLRRGHRAPRLPSLGDPGVWPPSPPHRKSVCPVPFLPRVRKFQTSRPSSLRMRVLGPWRGPPSTFSVQPHADRPLPGRPGAPASWGAQPRPRSSPQPRATLTVLEGALVCTLPPQRFLWERDPETRALSREGTRVGLGEPCTPGPGDGMAPRTTPCPTGGGSAGHPGSSQ